jgi:hypothetical protein
MKVIDLATQISNDAPEPTAKPSLSEIVANALVRQDANPPKPELVFALNDMPIFTKKSLSMISGKAGKGKTTVISWIIAKLIPMGTKVIWIDTEQGEYYASRTQSWTLRMAAMTSCDNLEYYDVRAYTPQERIAIIDEVISTSKPELLILDGVRDLMYDINNTEESTHVIGHLLKWSDQHNIHILSVLHENKKDGNARGHIGTELFNKAETVIKVDQNEDKLIICSPEKSRAAGFEPFAFARDEHGMPYIVDGFSGPVATSGGTAKQVVDPTDPSWNDAHTEIVNFIFSNSEYLKYSELIDFIWNYFQKNGGSVGKSKARDFVAHYLLTGIIWKNPYVNGHAKYQKNPKWLGFPYFERKITAKEGEPAPF